jgi:outer membrane receptor protein involved in Fe transport
MLAYTNGIRINNERWDTVQNKLPGIAFIYGTSALAACLTTFAQAQQSSFSAGADSGQLSEIVVTAEKRDATVQTTPISLTAISGADLQARGVTDLSGLMASIPGVSIRSSGPGLTEFEMRGMSSTGGNSPTVGFYYDDTLLTAAADTNEGKVVISPAMYDVSRIEVLRGPQGTLYGSGSMGGTIKIVPNAPDPSHFDSSVEGTFSDTNAGGFNQAENGMVNLPIGGGLAALRIVASYEDDAGWIHRIVAQPGTFPLATATGARGDVAAAPVAKDYKDVNDTQRTTVRISGMIQPIEGLTITPAFFYQKLTAGGLPQIDGDPGTSAHYQPFDVPESVNDVFRLGSVKLAYHTDAFEIDSNTAYWTRWEPTVQDTSESWALGIGLPYDPAAGGIGAGNAIEENYTHQTSEELRVSSVGDSKFQWLIGYFYQDFFSALDIYYPGQADPFQPGNNILFSYLSPTKILQQSVFGQATYNITSSLAATVGARRYSYDESNVSVQGGGLEGSTTTVTTDERDQGVTPKFSLSYTFSPDLLVYATGAKGFRPGGGTGPVPTTGNSNCEAALQAAYGTTAFVPGPTGFKPDDVWSYELGEKWRGLGGRVSVNASAFLEKWKGVQQTADLTCGYTYTANAGDARIYGGELEVQALITPEFTAAINSGYTHAVLQSAALLGSGFEVGTPIQDDPKWNGSFSLAYRHPLSDQLALTARAETTYVASRTDATYAINTLPSYELTNARGGIQGSNWSAVLFVNNIANKQALISDITQDAENLKAYNRIAVSQPRTIGIDLNYRFGK